jgi:hypothetical protein
MTRIISFLFAPRFRPGACPDKRTGASFRPKIAPQPFQFLTV